MYVWYRSKNMKYIVKTKCYHNTHGLLQEGEIVELTADEVKEYDKKYFASLFDAIEEADKPEE